MKIAIITDTHSGIKNGSDIFINNERQFYEKVFFPRCLKEGITKILHLGDYFDHRKYVNIKSLSSNREMFLEKIKEYNMTLDLIPGNHDTYFKSTNDICSVNEIVKNYSDRITLHMTPEVVDFYGLRIALLPWINAENYAASIDFIKNADAPILGGHLELSGFEMMKGMPPSSHGMNADLLSRFELVMSGHYHTKSQRNNIAYLGTPYELTWADCNDPKYFHILDCSTRELIPVRNPITLFNRLSYDDSRSGDDIAHELSKHNFKKLESTFVKVVVRHKKNPFLFDKFIDAINDNNPFELKIVESFDEYSANNVDVDDESIATDTVTLLNNYVDMVETELDRDRIKTRLQELYAEAQQLDSL